jgi:hypothetical protein
MKAKKRDLYSESLEIMKMAPQEYLLYCDFSVNLNLKITSTRVCKSLQDQCIYLREPSFDQICSLLFYESWGLHLKFKIKLSFHSKNCFNCLMLHLTVNFESASFAFLNISKLFLNYIIILNNYIF